MRGSAGICADDETLRRVMQRALEQADFTVRATATGADALAAFVDDPPDVLVLDIGLRDGDGRDVCRALRARGVHTPVLFLAARDAAAERIAAADAGGDDYLAKPFPLAALLVRIGSLTGPRAGHPPHQDDAEPHLDRSARAIVAGDLRISLTPTEFRLLALLTDRRGAVVTRAELVATGWPGGAAVTDNALDTYLARLRRKLRAAGAAQGIRTRRGTGYELQ